MSGNQDVPPLSPSLRALVDAERDNVVANPARAALVLAATEGMIASSIAAGAGATAVAASAGVGAKASAAVAAKGALTISIGKVVGIAVVAFAAGGGVGVVIDRATSPRQPVPQALPATASPVTVAPPREAPLEQPALAVPSASVTAAPPAPAPVASVPLPAATTSAATRGRGDLAQEQAIIDAARAGLASGRNDDVIVATERHAQTFPRGQFSEERDAMRVIALARLGRVAEARRRADQFRSAYPTSALLPKVQAALD